jgi:hypothetical protein
MLPCSMQERARELWNRSRTASRSPVVAHLNRQLREGFRRHASVCAVPETQDYHNSERAHARKLPRALLPAQKTLYPTPTLAP